MPHSIHVIDNFITPEDAAILIEEQDNPSETNPYPPYYAERFGGTNFPYNKRVLDLQIKYGHKGNELVKELYGFKNPVYVFKSFGSHWETGTRGGVHTDAQDPEPWIEWSSVIYLSDPADYEGGEIFFPNQDFSYKPRQYSAVFFPSAGTEYVHGITTVTSGHRYTLLYMHTSLPEHADPDFTGGVKLEKADWAVLSHPNYDK